MKDGNGHIFIDANPDPLEHIMALLRVATYSPLEVVNPPIVPHVPAAQTMEFQILSDYLVRGLVPKEIDIIQWLMDSHRCPIEDFAEGVHEIELTFNHQRLADISLLASVLAWLAMVGASLYFALPRKVRGDAL